MNLDEWNAALFADVKARGQRDRLLYLYVDRDLLARISGLSPSEAVEDFCQAFRAAASGYPFRRAAALAERWQAQGFPGDPPIVAALAMTVLAVTEEPLGGPHGVYRRQNMLLGFPPKPVAPRGYDRDVPLLWNVWNAWLGGPGSIYGRPSAHTHPHWTRQGWARSQGLIRHRDRLRIEQFLEDFHTAPEGVATVQVFREWLTYRGASASDLRAKLEDDAAQVVVQDVIDDELARWRREGSRARPTAATRGRLHFDDWSGDFSAYVEVDQAWVGVPLNLGDDRPYVPDAGDVFIRVSVTASTDRLLREGVEHRLTDTVSVRFGGDPVYVMRDEPLVSGRLQCRAGERATNYHVLAHEEHLPRLTTELGRAGITVAPKPSSVRGWWWLENLRLDRDSNLIRVVGLAAMVPAVDRPLEGGLSVADQTYLVGGEPDLLLSHDTQGVVTLDGQRLSVAPGTSRVSLADLGLDPGEHAVSLSYGQIRFRTVDFAKQQASWGGVGRAVTRSGVVAHFGEPDRQSAGEMVLAGAVILGDTKPAGPVTIRVAPDATCLALAEDGSLHQIWPEVPGWLQRLGISPATVDVLDAARLGDARAAFVITSHRQGWRWTAIPSSAPRRPGRVESQLRPNLVGSLVTRPRCWVGARDDRGASHLLSLAMRPVHRSERSRSPGRRRASRASTPRTDVAQERLPDNPYDDMLTWISEQEHSRVSTTQFASTWGWLCRRYGHADLADRWRQAAWTLSVLGHVERDFARRQIAAAPAALVALPSSSGMSVLAGSRPVRLLERMDDPDDDDPAVAAAARQWTLHYRTPTDLHGVPLGPTAVLVEWDHSTTGIVEQGLERLGVSVHGFWADRLLLLHPSLRQIVEAGQRLDMSPAREVWRWQPCADRWREWQRSTTDTATGLYRYLLARGAMFAWRAGLDMPLVQVEPAVGKWLTMAALGHSELLIHHVSPRVLLVPAYLPLPTLLARTLTLRTGLPPYRGFLANSQTSYLAYENVDIATVEHVGYLLQQKPKTTTEPLRMS